MNIFLIEDDWIQLEDIKITIEELGHTCVGNTDDGIDALDKIAACKPDVVMIDLYLNGKLTGVSIAKRIKNEFPLIPIIFLSSQIEDALIEECLGVNPVAYLTKPLHAGDLKAALIKCRLILTELNTTEEEDLSHSNEQILIRVGKNLRPVKFIEISYLQSDVKNYVAIYTNDGAHYSVKKSLAGFETFLPNFFYRIHKEYIINTTNIKSINENEQTVLIADKHLPIGKIYKNDFLKTFTIL